MSKAAHDIARDIAIAARRRAGEVGLEAGQPFLGRFLTMMCNERAGQRDVIRMQAGANADFTLPGGIGKLLIGDPGQVEVLGHIHRAGTHRKSEPVAIVIPQRLGNRGAEDLRLDALRKALLDKIDENAGIDSHQNICRRLVTFRDDALGDPVLQEDGVDRDPGRLREGIDQRLDQPRFAGGIEVELLCEDTLRACKDRQHRPEHDPAKFRGSHRHDAPWIVSKIVGFCPPARDKHSRL